MAVVLERIDLARNMMRFYRLDVQPTLFGEWALVCEWGRIGSGGAVRCVVFDSEESAEAARVRQRRVKERRGYGKIRDSINNSVEVDNTNLPKLPPLDACGAI